MSTRELRVEHDMEADFGFRREVEEIHAELRRSGRLRWRRRIRDRDGVPPKLRRRLLERILEEAAASGEGSGTGEVA